MKENSADALEKREGHSLFLLKAASTAPNK
jgi:hypothetical protein